MPLTGRIGAGAGKDPSLQPLLDPEEYKNAKRKLKKAVLEFYRYDQSLHLPGRAAH